MTRGQLPKAYLRIDPNIDQTHPDNLDGFIRLLCVANRQPRRGWFRSRAVLTSAMGKAATTRFYARGDVIETPDGVQVPGWENWQEGDMTVGERVGRFRAKHAVKGVTSAVTDPVTKPLPAVTSTVTKSLPASEAVRQLGSKASNGLPTTERAVAAPTSEATRTKNKPVGSWTPVGLVDWGGTLDSRQLEAWSTFGPDWDDFKVAWLGRGLKYPPRGTAEDDPNAGNPSQRALLWSILDTRPKDLVDWVNESPKGSVTGVITHVIERWHSVRDEAGREPA